MLNSVRAASVAPSPREVGRWEGARVGQRQRHCQVDDTGTAQKLFLGYGLLAPLYRVTGNCCSCGERIDFAREVGYILQQLFTCQLLWN